MDRKLVFAVVLILEISSVFSFYITQVNNETDVYEVKEDKTTHTLTITNPKSEKPVLREIVYYHIIEKPYEQVIKPSNIVNLSENIVKNHEALDKVTNNNDITTINENSDENTINNDIKLINDHVITENENAFKNINKTTNGENTTSHDNIIAKRDMNENSIMGSHNITDDKYTTPDQDTVNILENIATSINNGIISLEDVTETKNNSSDTVVKKLKADDANATLITSNSTNQKNTTNTTSETGTDYESEYKHEDKYENNIVKIENGIYDDKNNYVKLIDADTQQDITEITENDQDITDKNIIINESTDSRDETANRDNDTASRIESKDDNYDMNNLLTIDEEPFIIIVADDTEDDSTMDEDDMYKKDDVNHESAENISVSDADKKIIVNGNINNDNNNIIVDDDINSDFTLYVENNYYNPNEGKEGVDFKDRHFTNGHGFQYFYPDPQNQGSSENLAQDEESSIDANPNEAPNDPEKIDNVKDTLGKSEALNENQIQLDALDKERRKRAIDTLFSVNEEYAPEDMLQNTMNKASERIRRSLDREATYGMTLTGKKGVVWNELDDKKVFFPVGADKNNIEYVNTNELRAMKNDNEESNTIKEFKNSLETKEYYFGFIEPNKEEYDNGQNIEEFKTQEFNLDKTYGMSLSSGNGIVWNDFGDDRIYYGIGESQDKDRITRKLSKDDELINKKIEAFHDFLHDKSLTEELKYEPFREDSTKLSTQKPIKKQSSTKKPETEKITTLKPSVTETVTEEPKIKEDEKTIDLNKTYGMRLAGDQGIVWSDSNGNTMSHHIGEKTNTDKGNGKIEAKKAFANEGMKIEEPSTNLMTEMPKIEPLTEEPIINEPNPEEPKANRPLVIGPTNEKPATKEPTTETPKIENQDELKNTYGMSLTEGEGIVWNDLTGDRVSYYLGEASNDSEEDNHDGGMNSASDFQGTSTPTDENKNNSDNDLLNDIEDVIKELQNILAEFTEKTEESDDNGKIEDKKVSLINELNPEEPKTNRPIVIELTTERQETKKPTIETRSIKKTEELVKTYGMSLTEGEGIVWNDLNGDRVSYHVGEPSKDNEVDSHHGEIDTPDSQGISTSTDGNKNNSNTDLLNDIQDVIKELQNILQEFTEKTEGSKNETDNISDRVTDIVNEVLKNETAMLENKINELIEQEVAKQLEEYVATHNETKPSESQGGKDLHIDEKIEENVNKEVIKKKEDCDEKKKKESPNKIVANTIYGNSVGNNNVTNVFIFNINNGSSIEIPEIDTEPSYNGTDGNISETENEKPTENVSLEAEHNTEVTTENVIPDLEEIEDHTIESVQATTSSENGNPNIIDNKENHDENGDTTVENVIEAASPLTEESEATDENKLITGAEQDKDSDNTTEFIGSATDKINKNENIENKTTDTETSSAHDFSETNQEATAVSNELNSIPKDESVENSEEKSSTLSKELNHDSEANNISEEPNTIPGKESYENLEDPNYMSEEINGISKYEPNDLSEEPHDILEEPNDIPKEPNAKSESNDVSNELNTIPNEVENSEEKLSGLSNELNHDSETNNISEETNSIPGKESYENPEDPNIITEELNAIPKGEPNDISEQPHISEEPNDISKEPNANSESNEVSNDLNRIPKDESYKTREKELSTNSKEKHNSDSEPYITEELNDIPRRELHENIENPNNMSEEPNGLPNDEPDDISEELYDISEEPNDISKESNADSKATDVSNELNRIPKEELVEYSEEKLSGLSKELNYDSEANNISEEPKSIPEKDSYENLEDPNYMSEELNGIPKDEPNDLSEEAYDILEEPNDISKESNAKSESNDVSHEFNSIPNEVENSEEKFSGLSKELNDNSETNNISEEPNSIPEKESYENLKDPNYMSEELNGIPKDETNGMSEEPDISNEPSEVR